MTRLAVERRVFVVGAPRSGTTLVQSLLAAHSAMTSFTESHFFWRHFTRFPARTMAVLIRDPRPRLRQFLAENGEEPPDAADWFETNGRWALRAWPLRPFRTGRVARQLLLVLDDLALRRGRAGWIEKTPMHLRYVPFIERVSGAGGSTRFVHVIRDGLDVVASLREASRSWERPYDLDTCIRRWNADVGLSLRRAGRPNDCFVCYEALAARPEAVLRRLLADLGLEWEADLLQRHASGSDRLVTQEEWWKADVGRPPRPSRTSDRALTTAERDRATRRLRRDLYERILARAGHPSDAMDGVS